MKIAESAHKQNIKVGEDKAKYPPDGEGYNILSFSYHVSTERGLKNLNEYLNKEGKVLNDYILFFN